MSDIEERKFYLQLWAFTTGPAIDAMHMYFEINVLNKKNLETFLNDKSNKHILFHQCFPDIPCCECNIHSLASTRKKGSLESKQLKILFDDTSLPQPNHEKMTGRKIIEYCLCKYSSKCSIDIDSLDVSLFCAVVQHCCPTKMNFAWRKSVKEVRNFLAHGNGQVGKSDFEQKWKLLEIATLGFASELGSKCLRMFTKEIAQLKSFSVEVLKEMLEKSNDQLAKTLNILNRFKPLYTDVADSKNILQTMHSQQLEQNIKFENTLERMESLLLGFVANQRIDKFNSSVSVFDSEESILSNESRSTSTNAETSSIYLQCEVESSVLDEDKASKQITKDENEKDEKQFKVNSAEKKCLLLHLQSSRKIFESVESLWYAITSLIKRIVEAGEIDTSVESTMSIKLALTSPVTQEERRVICATLLQYGDLNEKHILNQTQSSKEINFDIKKECFSTAEEDIAPSVFQEVVKKDQSMLGFKDDFVTCQHCKQVFSCDECTSRMNIIKRLNQALQIKEQTIQRLKWAETKREDGIMEEQGQTKGNTSKLTEKDMSEEPKRKRRKTAITSDIVKFEDASTSSNKDETNILVDTKQALQKLGEIPLVDTCIDIYRNYMKDLKEKWCVRAAPIRPRKEKEILDNLLKERQQRLTMVAKLIDVIHKKDVFTTTDEAYGTDIGFMDVENPVPKCNQCQTEEASQISCYCNNCKVFICDNCAKEHRLKIKEHSYTYILNILRKYEKTNAWPCQMYEIIDMKYLSPKLIAILGYHGLLFFDMAGSLVMQLNGNFNCSSRIACFSHNKLMRLVLVEPSRNQIKVFTGLNGTTTSHTYFAIPTNKRMTGGIACRENTLYVAFYDSIGIMDAAGRIQRDIIIPNVGILHFLNNDKMLCVYSKRNSDKTMSYIDLTSDRVYDFESFLFYPEAVTSDNMGNIIFLADGVIWQADNEGKSLKTIVSPDDTDNFFQGLTYNKDSNLLLNGGRNRSDGIVLLYKQLE